MMATALRKNVSEPTESEKRLAQYAERHNKAWDDIKSSTQDYDHNLLTFSSGALGLSLAFIKDIVPFGQAVWMRLLYASWIAFAMSILVTVASFQISIAAQKCHLVFLREYYLQGKQESFDKESFWSKMLDYCTFVAGTLFLAGLICTVAFACKNVGRKYMSERETTTKVTTTGDMQKGLKPAGMTPLSEGLKPAGMIPAQPVPVQSAPSAPASVPAQPCQPTDKSSSQD
jgi:hypothetical protein